MGIGLDAIRVDMHHLGADLAAGSGEDRHSEVPRSAPATGSSLGRVERVKAWPDHYYWGHAGHCECEGKNEGEEAGNGCRRPLSASMSAYIRCHEKLLITPPKLDTLAA